MSDLIARGMAANALSSLESTTLNIQKPRILPTMQGFKPRRMILGRSASGWKSQTAGLGYDIVWDPETGKYALLYGGYDGTHQTVGIAYSDDLITWTDYGSNPVFSQNPTSGQWDSGGITFPQLWYENGTWYMFYIGWPNTGFEQGQSKIGIATATSLKGPWTRYSGNPVIYGGMGGIVASGDDVFRPNIIKVGGTYYVFCNGGPYANEQITYCTASNILGPWTMANEMVLVGSDVPYCTSTTVSDPDVIQMGDYFFMFFWTNTSNGNNCGVVWTHKDDFPYNWKSQDQSIISITHNMRPLVFEHNGTMHMIYNDTSPGGDMYLCDLHRRIVDFGYEGTASTDLYTSTQSTASGKLHGTSRYFHRSSLGIKHSWKECRIWCQVYAATVSGGGGGGATLKLDVNTDTNPSYTTVWSNTFASATSATSFVIDTQLPDLPGNILQIRLSGYVNNASDTLQIFNVSGTIST